MCDLANGSRTSGLADAIIAGRFADGDTVATSQSGSAGTGDADSDFATLHIHQNAMRSYDIARSCSVVDFADQGETACKTEFD